MTLGCSTTFGWEWTTTPAIRRSGRTDHGRADPGDQRRPARLHQLQGRWLWDKTLKDYAPDVVLIGYVVQDARKAAYSDRSQAVLQGDHRYLKDNVLYNSRVYLGLRSMLGGIQVSAKERPQNGQGGIIGYRQRILRTTSVAGGEHSRRRRYPVLVRLSARAGGVHRSIGAF